MSLDFDLCDPHQHFWDLRAHYYPWLCDETPIAFRYGDYASLRRKYMPDDYRADTRAWRVVKTVYIEAEWDPSDPLGEMQAVASWRDTYGLPSVAIAQAWLDRADVGEVLDAHAARDFVRGIRHKPRANASPDDRRPGGMTDALWRAGYARLAPLGLHFELQTPWWHLHEATELARDFPDTRIVLNHTGLPADRSSAGLDGWRRAMRQFATCPNVTVKISGLGVPGERWTADLNREVVLTTIELFGTDRAMFASNFPVDGLCATFDEIYAGFDAITDGFEGAERRALFHDNAVRIYRIGE